MEIYSLLLKVPQADLMIPQWVMKDMRHMFSIETKEFSK